MSKIRSYRFDRPDLNALTLHEESKPTPQRHELLLKVHAVSLNYRDVGIQIGNYIFPAEEGLIPCSDAAAEVVEVGSGVTIYKPGDRVINTFHPRWYGGPSPPKTALADVYGSGSDGWLTEYKVVSQEAVVPLPDVFSWEEGSTLPCAAETAWTALQQTKPVKYGDTVLTLGTGGVSIFAVQLCKLLGVKVIATTSSKEKAETLKKLGADEVINYNEVKDWGSKVKELTGGKGVDRVIEVGGPATINQSLAAVARGGEVVLTGFLSRENPGIDYFKLMGSGAVVWTVSVGDRVGLEEVVKAAEVGGLKPVIDRVIDFDNAKEAFDLLESGKFVGKIVVRVPH